MVKVISLSYIFHVLYVLCFTRPRYQVSVYRTIGPLVLLIFAPKHRLWVLVRTASLLVRTTEAVLTCTQNQCFEQKYEKYLQFSSENEHFYSRIYGCILHGRVFVMQTNEFFEPLQTLRVRLGP